MKTKDLLDEYAMIHWRNGLFQLGSTEEEKQRMPELIKELEASIRKEVYEEIYNIADGMTGNMNTSLDYDSGLLDLLKKLEELSKGIDIK